MKRQRILMEQQVDSETESHSSSVLLPECEEGGVDWGKGAKRREGAYNDFLRAC